MTSEKQLPHITLNFLIHKVGKSDQMEMTTFPVPEVLF
jgi:hypothetical protein